MRGNLLTALLGLLVVLAAGKEDLGLQNFNLTQFSGMWYEIALASNLEHQSPSPGRKVGAVRVEQDGAQLSLTSVSDHMNLCVKEKNQAVKGDAPGKFKLPLDSGGKEVIVVATDYKTYAIMNIVLHRGGKPSSVLKLYTRTLDHNEKATEELVEKAVEQGLSVSDVQLLTKDLTCVNLLS
ncbi:lipocalin-15 [Dama dama]|uniref:lipocalin-15 n=1 Tax=Dama dama TaxID=30532 RepID=UPI002A3589C2|nr:lipocalin-15 [Dama dama]